jgi:hypothetical protein
VSRVGKFRVSRKWLLLVTVAGLTTACDGPRRQALHELAAAGVEPSGHSLVTAALAQDAHTVSLLVTAGVHT